MTSSQVTPNDTKRQQTEQSSNTESDGKKCEIQSSFLPAIRNLLGGNRDFEGEKVWDILGQTWRLIVELSARSVRGSLCETNPVGREWTLSVDGIHEIRTADGKKAEKVKGRGSREKHEPINLKSTLS